MKKGIINEVLYENLCKTTVELSNYRALMAGDMIVAEMNQRYFNKEYDELLFTFEKYVECCDFLTEKNIIIDHTFNDECDIIENFNNLMKSLDEKHNEQCKIIKKYKNDYIEIYKKFKEFNFRFI